MPPPDIDRQGSLRGWKDGAERTLTFGTPLTDTYSASSVPETNADDPVRQWFALKLTRRGTLLAVEARLQS